MRSSFSKKSSYTFTKTVIASLLAVCSVNVNAGTAANNLSVTATVAASCTIATNAVAFGAYDPIVTNKTANLDGTGTVTVTCTNGSIGTITLGQGANATIGSTDALPLRQMAATTNRLSYQLYSDAARLVVWGNAIGAGIARTGSGVADPLTVYGNVTAGQNVPAGSYSDTVVATVTF